MRIYYPLDPDEAPTAADLAAEREAAARLALPAERDAEGWTLATIDPDPETF